MFNHLTCPSITTDTQNIFNTIDPELFQIEQLNNLVVVHKLQSEESYLLKFLLNSNTCFWDN